MELNPRQLDRRNRRAWVRARPRVAWRRPGTVMVYVLGVLTLVALIGLILIARTHGESKRVANETTASSQEAAMNGVIRIVQGMLRDDVWGPSAYPIYPLNGDTTGGPLEETNEPYDAPGPDDRWLASLTPYLLGDRLTGWDPFENPELAVEHDVLAWHRVSYLGTDVLLPSAGVRFAWADNVRTIANGDVTSYSDANLQDVWILQTPPPDGVADLAPLIPGSTTNATIAKARAAWIDNDKTPLEEAGLVPKFPYFDTNADGVIDLYDASGDGVPDAPISFVVPLDTAGPNDPKQLYAVIRVVDHAGMLNVNVASSWRVADGSTMTFDDPFGSPPLRRERRGRRATELLLDEVAHRDDGFYDPTTINRTGGLTAYRWNDGASPVDPAIYDADVVRRALLGGLLGSNYLVYGPGDEAALRHRGSLPSYDLRGFDKTLVTGDYRTIDRALRWSLLWTRQVDASSSYLALPSRWNRLNSNYQPEGSTTTYEGYDDANGLGWRTLYLEDDPAAVRRPMFTTVSHAVVPPPAGVTLNVDGTDVRDLSLNPVRFPNGLDPEEDRQMTWPVLSRLDPAPAIQNLPDWMRIQPIDINMSDPTKPPEVTKELYIRYLAAAMYLALDGLEDLTEGSYHNIPLSDLASTPVVDERLNREWLAWQFALNMADYRDSDSEPTLLEWFYDPNQPEQSCYLFGLEKQPFFTEAYTYFTAGTTEPPTEDTWFFAVELFVPPYWSVPTANLHLLASSEGPQPQQLPSDLIPLGLFRQIGSGLPVPAMLDGGADGAYFVLCSTATGAAPPGLDVSTFYQYGGFRIDTTGYGDVELVSSLDGTETHPATHVLDVIGPTYSGGGLAGRAPPVEYPGLGAWAKRPAGIPEGASRSFSLLRSTHGWRFTACWHIYTEGLWSAQLPGPPLRPSLGTANGTSDSLDGNIPESIWPAMAAILGGEPQFPTSTPGVFAPGFASGLPYEAFDSVGELGRMLMIGPVRYNPGLPRLPSLVFGIGDNLPATAILALILNEPSTGDLPSKSAERVAAGRVDFLNAKKPPGSADTPWTWRLFDYLTAQSHLFDGVDNDGDGSADDEFDRTEGADVLYRLAGRINLNTAPPLVLRSVPYMSMLPTSSEFAEHVGVVGNPAGVFGAYSSHLWDFAGAIVARREHRKVPLRLMDTILGDLRPVAIAEPGLGSRAPAPFARIAELVTLMNNQALNVVDALNGNHSLYRIDRFAADPAIAMYNHKLPGPPDSGLGDPPPGLEFLSGFSPDYRYRSDNETASYVPIPTAGDPFEAGGIRGRDIFLARWANLLTTRSDVFTAYIALLDEDGNYVHRTRVTLDRSACFREVPLGGPAARRTVILPRILGRGDTSYSDDMR